MGAGHGAAAGLRALPSVEVLAASLPGARAEAVRVARAVIDARRAELLAGDAAPADLGERARAELARLARPSLRRVLNATGVVVHTNLGRAPLAAAARAAVTEAADGYAALEVDLAAGGRGARSAHVEELLRAVTGAQAGFAVNNAAGAVLVCVAALAGPGRSVVVSRGQLVEIGGGFRVPEVVAQSGSRLVEVGTTNRTRIDDYAAALDAGVGCVLRAHPSNFRTVGFVEEVGIEALCELGVPVVDDVGSGVLDPALLDVLRDEPGVRRSVAAGAALVCFSGDKLLGGPQAGVIVGRADAVERARRHPLARALRIDRLCLAALAATLRLHLDPAQAVAEIPVLRMLAAPPQALEARARRLAAAAGGTVVEAVARVGGGALPLAELPGPAVALPGDPEAWAAALRGGEPPVIGRISDGRLLLDVRTLTDSEVEVAARAVAAAAAAGAAPARDRPDVPGAEGEPRG